VLSFLSVCIMLFCLGLRVVSDFFLRFFCVCYIFFLFLRKFNKDWYVFFWNVFVE